MSNHFQKIAKLRSRRSDISQSAIYGDQHVLKLQEEIGIFTDGKSWCTMTYFMNQKSKVLVKFKQYKSFVETQTNYKLKKLHVDGGGEFLSKEFRKFLLDNRIQLDITTPHSSSQNGIAEQLNWILVEHT